MIRFWEQREGHSYIYSKMESNKGFFRGSDDFGIFLGVSKRVSFGVFWWPFQFVSPGLDTVFGRTCPYQKQETSEKNNYQVIQSDLFIR